MFIRAYLRASTAEQHADRAKKQLQDFATSHGLTVANWYIENESGAKLHRPELTRLLSDCQPNDIILIESVDRLTRLKKDDWSELKKQIADKGVRIVVADLPTSHIAINGVSDDITGTILTALNDFMIELLASMARSDYETRRQRQAQGIERAQKQGKYKGRPTNTAKYQKIIKFLESGLTHREIMDTLKCSPSTIQNAIKWHGGINTKQLTFTTAKVKNKR